MKRISISLLSVVIELYFINTINKMEASRLLVLFILNIIFHYCIAQGTWVQKANFGGAARQEASGFSIGNKGYIGLGWLTYYDDFWEWDQATDTWTQKANFPGGGKQGAFSFSIGTKGYIINGEPYSNQLWEWEQGTNIWVQKANFPGPLREDGTGCSFAINTKGYIATGIHTLTNTYYNDLWEYDQITDSWSQKANYPGQGRLGTIGFSLGNKAYIGTGTGADGLYKKDFWEWDQATDTWTRKADLCGSARGYGAGFSIADKGYIGLGFGSGGIYHQDFWEWDSTKDNWKKAADFGGTARAGTVFFSLLNKGYVGTGVGTNGLNRDLWEFTPADTLRVTVSSQNIECNGLCSGTATVNAEGGSPPYSYSWSNGQTTQTATGLCIGTYTCVISDQGICANDTVIISVTITEPLPIISAFTSVTAISCNSGNDGSISITASGGTGVLTYSWSPGNPTGNGTNSITDLSAGTYTVTIADSNSCNVTDSVTITESPELLVTIQSIINVSCNGGSDGSATALASGGSLPYTYLWSSGGVGVTAPGLSAGTYTVTVTDSNSCIATDTVLISEPVLLSAVIVASADVSCTNGADGSATAGASGGVLPYTYLWSTGATDTTVHSLVADSYTITVTDSNSCVATANITIQQPLPVSITIGSSPAICSSNTGIATATVMGGTLPYTYEWSSGGGAVTEDSLLSGTYSLTVTDNNGCVQSETVVITSINPLTLTVATTPTVCDTTNGTATVTVVNGTFPYTYSWNSNPIQTDSTAVGLGVGTYTVTVTDVNTCVQTQIVGITQTPAPTAVVAATLTSISYGNNTQLIGLGGENYSWTPVTGLSCTTCQNPSAVPLETTTYCVIVTDTNGCTDSACITITVEIPCGKIEIPTAFSPNNDGHNDLFVLQGLGNCIDKFSMLIFDRWGEKVFETENIVTSWDGEYRGKPMNPGVFVYYLTATLTTGEKIIKKGNITLIR